MRKTPDGTTSHSTRLSKDDSQVAGYPGLPLSGEEVGFPPDKGGLRRVGFSLSKWLSLSALVIVLDQISKAWITSHFVYGENIYVLSIFNLVLAHNTGAAFSFLHDAGGMQRWLFSVIAVIAALWIATLLRKHASQLLFSLALSLILGGALGNLIDRIAYGYVVDFLSFHWGEYYFPAFNIADSAITCGAFLMILDSFTGKVKWRS